MEIIDNPPRSDWDRLCRRPVIPGENLGSIVREILEGVRNESDSALMYYSAKFDGFRGPDPVIPEEVISGAENEVPEKLKNAIETARQNILKFHSNQLVESRVTTTTDGVTCWRKSVPIEKVGLYIPGGTAPLFSTLLMLGIPAKIAGCSEIVVCTPPDRNGQVSPVILYTARLIGIEKIFRVGGAQAIAAMAFGTETIPSVYKIFGPGNRFVTKAKEMVQSEGVAIDMPAGPSEVLVIADRNANPAFVAADLLSQAEHGTDSQVVMVSDSRIIIEQAIEEVGKQLETLPRKDIAASSILNSRFILLQSLDECIDFSNAYAPEHLIINCDDNRRLAELVLNAGSVFLGQYSCESAGDYASGTNHTLPTHGYARNHSGISTSSFMKEITFQELTGPGLLNLGPAIETLASAESLDAHKNAVSLRLKALGYERY
jgi:histidinol dehydrogenase